MYSLLPLATLLSATNGSKDWHWPGGKEKLILKAFFYEPACIIVMIGYILISITRQSHYLHNHLITSIQVLIQSTYLLTFFMTGLWITYSLDKKIYPTKYHSDQSGREAGQS